ncbi:hypothetical protein B0O80DRAFT_500598 [Mortierella sp. GBAus27b]|nr:hypothetical protein BGX31_001901 [Mortierella sp. GBA43]KAI8350818.1 hypothetical protein B0O80DRAFT_500598 [Mortierella sp. GBAus27b]
MSLPVPLPNLKDIVNDLSILRAASISLSHVADGTDLLNGNARRDAKAITSLEKLEQFKASTQKSQREEGVVENGFEVAVDFLKMQQELSVSKQEMNTLQERIGGLGKELGEVQELIAHNPVQ